MKSYHAFLVRCWCDRAETSDGQESWRFSAMEIGGTPQAPRGFADFDELMNFLAGETMGRSIRTDIPPNAGDNPAGTTGSNVFREQGDTEA